MKPKAPPSKLPQCSTLSRRARDLDSLKVENELETQSTFYRLFTSKECEQITNNGERLWAKQCDTWSVVELGWDVSPSYMPNGRLWTKILDVASSYWTDDPESPGAKAIELSKRFKIQRMRMTNWIIQSASKTSPLDELGLSGPKFFGSHSTLADGLDAADTLPLPPEDDECVQSNVRTFSEKIVVIPPRSKSKQAIQFRNTSVYNITQASRCKCVIFSNRSFNAGESWTRKGTEIDEQALYSLFFEQLHFNVEVHRDKSVNAMRTLIRAASQECSVECFLLYILSHGTSDGVCGSDGEILKIEEITTMLGTQNCPSLAGKPKLLFIQACRGNRIMRKHVLDSFKATTSEEGFNMTTMDGYNLANSESGFPASKGRLGRDVVCETTVPYFRREMDPRVSSPFQVQPSMFVINTSRPDMACMEPLIKIRHRTIEQNGDTRPDPSGSELPVEADMVIAYSTQLGYLSYRDETNGSWYIQVVVEVFSRNAHREDLVEMLDVVKGQVAKKVTRAEDGDPGGVMQVPDISNSLTKKLYLFPGLIDDS